jgi:hypothetical protein
VPTFVASQGWCGSSCEEARCSNNLQKIIRLGLGVLSVCITLLACRRLWKPEQWSELHWTKKST